jgi:hypothetical protein
MTDREAYIREFERPTRVNGFTRYKDIGELDWKLVTVFLDTVREVFEGEEIDETVEIHVSNFRFGGCSYADKGWMIRNPQGMVDENLKDHIIIVTCTYLRQIRYTGVYEYQHLQYLCDSLTMKRGYTAIRYIALHECAHVMEQLYGYNIRDDYDVTGSYHDEFFETVLIDLLEKYEKEYQP